MRHLKMFSSVIDNFLRDIIISPWTSPNLLHTLVKFIVCTFFIHEKEIIIFDQHEIYGNPYT